MKTQGKTDTIRLTENKTRSIMMNGSVFIG